jgi:hypothetical protein
MSEVAERLAANVVTSENLAEFNAKRMGLADLTPQARLSKKQSRKRLIKDRVNRQRQKMMRQQQRIENKIRSWKDGFQR